jgi:ATP-dependent DNA ligase
MSYQVSQGSEMPQRKKLIVRDSLGPNKPLPAKFRPMMAQSRDLPFDSRDFVFEFKWDGYRAAILDREKIQLISHNGLSVC